VLCAALSACVRRVAFQFSYDSKPLVDFVCRINELVCVSARTEMLILGAGFESPIDTGRRYEPQFFAMKEQSSDESYDRDRQDDAEEVTTTHSKITMHHVEVVTRAMAMEESIVRMINLIISRATVY